MASGLQALPPMILFPEAAWRDHLVPEEWEACLDAWILLAETHLSLPVSEFNRVSSADESLPAFLLSFVPELPSLHDTSKSSQKSKQLRKLSFLLAYKLMGVDAPPKTLVHWGFLADICKAYGKSNAEKLIELAWKRHSAALELSMSLIKSTLARELDAGLKGDLKTAEIQLRRLNNFLHISPKACEYFVAGSDFFDSLISCYKLMNPPLRKVIISTAYLCHIGLSEGEEPKLSSLIDQLYSLKSAAEAHRSGPTNINDSLVAELVTVTPLLKQVQQRIDASGSGSSRAKSVISALEAFKKPGSSIRNPNSTRRKAAKGKGKAIDNSSGLEAHDEIHIHRMSLISQVQDLFPDLGSGFVVKLLDEYDSDVEQVVAHLLEGSLPPHLEKCDRTEALESEHEGFQPDLAPKSTPTLLPSRRNVYDDDELDNLTVDTSRLHFGRRNPDHTADDVLQDRSNAPNKAAILSALAAFDSDDDERDDTYDVADVGGTIDSAVPGDDPDDANNLDAHDETLFRAYKSAPALFNRDAEVRRGAPRKALRQETGMTDEALEGWALMLSRDPKHMRRLEAKFSTFSGGQTELGRTSWRANTAGSGSEDSDRDHPSNRGRGGIQRRARRGGGGRGGGSVAGQPGDKETEVARQRKEANKSSRANHNRRAQRAKKMARGGFPG